MAKLPKKKTMIDTITRVQNYAYRLWQSDKLKINDATDINKMLAKLKKAIDK